MAKKSSEQAVARRHPFEELDWVWGWNPFREFGRSPRVGRLPDEAGTEGRIWSPAIDIAENDEAYIVTAEVPGSKRDDVTVETHGDLLTIRGEKRSEREEKKEQTRWVERSYGSFSRSFTLPSDASRDRVSAHFKDGVLTIEIPKTEEAKPQVVSIKG